MLLRKPVVCVTIAAALMLALIAAIQPGNAHADLFVTAAGTAEGFSLSTFATGFPTMTHLSNDSLLLTQSDRVVHLIAPEGGGFAAPVPEPSTFVLGITGLAGLVTLRKKFQPAKGKLRCHA
jgi:hypothetical protein